MIEQVAETLLDHSWYSHNGKPIVTGETGIETAASPDEKIHGRQNVALQA
jgi:hypothetical protein